MTTTRIERNRGFRIHAIVFAATLPVLFGINLFTTPYLWALWVLASWGIGLVAHWWFGVGPGVCKHARA